MKAILLAAGTGSRLQPLTFSEPKPLTRLVTTPVMETQIRHLAAAGVTDIVVNTSHLADRIESYFGNGESWGVNIGYSYEGALIDGELVGSPVGSGGGIRRIQDHSGFFDEPFLVLCGDAFVNFDVAGLYKQHQKNKALATILTQRVSPNSVEKYGVVVTDASGKISSFQEKPKRAEAKSLEANTGIYLFEPALVDEIPAGTSYDLGSELFPMMVERDLPLFALSQRFDWLDIGSPGDLFAANAHLLAFQTPGYALPGTELRPGLWVGSNCSIDPDTINVQGTVVIEGGCRIERGATLIGPSVIRRGSVLEAESEVCESYVGPYVRIPRGAVVESSIVTDGYVTHIDGTYESYSDASLGLSDARIPVTGGASGVLNFRKQAGTSS